jgi:Ca2+/Na+ antiporter
MNDTVVAIVSAFFIIGIVVGIVAVIAAAVFRADRRGPSGRS